MTERYPTTFVPNSASPAKFDRPLFVGYPRYSLEDVFDFLDDRPTEKRGDIYELLIKARGSKPTYIFVKRQTRSRSNGFGDPFGMK